MCSDLTLAIDCPFCGSTRNDLDISIKGNHVAVFCKKCHTYGPRVLCYAIHDRQYHYHYFKNKKDLKANSIGREYLHSDDSEITFDWFISEAVKKWNIRK